MAPGSSAMKNSGTSSLTSAVEVSAEAQLSATPWNILSGASNRPPFRRRWCAGASLASQYNTYPGAL